MKDELEEQGNPQGFGHSSSRLALEVAAVVALLVLVAVLVKSGLGIFAGWAAGLVPNEADRAIGRLSAQAYSAASSTTNDVPASDKERVEKIFADLQAGLPDEAKDLLKEARVTVKRDAAVNAFALPGGQVFVLTGLLERVGTDDAQLRGVLAHELGHAVLRHGMQNLVREHAAGIVMAMLFGNSDSIVALLASSASDLAGLRYSRSMEEEADAFGVALLRQTGRADDVEGLARFLEGMDKAPVPEFLSTHPDGAARAQALREAK